MGRPDLKLCALSGRADDSLDERGGNLVLDRSFLLRGRYATLCQYLPKKTHRHPETLTKTDSLRIDEDQRYRPRAITQKKKSSPMYM